MYPLAVSSPVLPVPSSPVLFRVLSSGAVMDVSCFGKAHFWSPSLALVLGILCQCYQAQWTSVTYSLMDAGGRWLLEGPGLLQHDQPTRPHHLCSSAMCGGHSGKCH